ncbi:flagellar hook-length control protein FliK [Paracoccus nototheniae]|uniref:Flagellar hook-length control protein FliK n=1 Tax=Paracoccus nototheniae TaxID=2489002 RepID=A0ABW4DTF7_9RHOB|nr:flagellar hook-length control protein FliK [Paracoccus nototheniae]
MADIQMIPNWPSRPSEAAQDASLPQDGASDFALPALSYVQPQPAPIADSAAMPGDALTRWLETVLGLTAGIGEAADPSFAAMDAGLPQIDIPPTAPENDPATMVELLFQPPNPSPAPPEADIPVLVQGTPPLPIVAEPTQGPNIVTTELRLPAQTQMQTPAALPGPGRVQAAASPAPAAQPAPGTSQAAPAVTGAGTNLSASAIGATTAMTRVQTPDRPAFRPPASRPTDPAQGGGLGQIPLLHDATPQRVGAEGGRTVLPHPVLVTQGSKVTATVPAGAEGSGDGDVNDALAVIGSRSHPAPLPEAERAAAGFAPVLRDAAGPPPGMMAGTVEPGGSAEPMNLPDAPRAGALVAGASPPAPDTGQAPDPRPVIRQVTEALVTIRGDRTEIALSPEELGRVRLIMTGPDRSHITIFAERPETLDLVRRNADLLTQHLADAGVSTDSMSFRRDDRAGWPDDAPQGMADDDDSPAPPDATLVRLTPASLSDRRLDIRI